MRKTTKGRNVQHVRSNRAYSYLLAKDGRRFHIEDPKAPKKSKTVSVPVRKGRAIQHPPNRLSPAFEVRTDAKFINYKTCAGAIRRGWS